MTTAEVITELAARLDMPEAEVARLYQTTIRTFRRNLARGQRFVLPGIGTIRTERRRPRKAYHPQHRRLIRVPMRRVVAFTPGKKLRERYKPS